MGGRGGAPQQYFSATPQAASRPHAVSLALPDLRLELQTDRGVFAADAVDAGTRYLLLEAPMPPPGAVRVADVGCGYGPIAIALAHRRPHTQIVAVDVNERARQLCQHNAEAAGLTNVAVLAPDVVSPDERLDAFYSNPPIRIGKAAMQRLLVEWLARLQPHGFAVLVVHKHLGSDSLQRWLDRAGHPARRLGSRLGYRLLEVRPQ